MSGIQSTLRFAEVWADLAVPEVAKTLALGATLTQQTWATLAAAPRAQKREKAPPGEPASSLTARHLETLVGLLEDPGPVLAKLPVLELGFADGEGAGGCELEAQRVLGEGGMGRVWLTLQRSLQRDLAVKVLKDDVVDSDAARALLAEGLLTGALEHPNIVPVHLLGRDKRGLPALVMKRIAGVPWSALLEDRKHPLLARFGRGHEDPLDAHVELLMRVCDAVHYAHRHRIVHRDLKPENVMVGEFGEVYVVDWGIATTARGAEHREPSVLGTPVYMAPEMVAREGPDARTDVYLLGALLHEVLTGTHRNQGETLFAVLASAFEPRPVEYGPEVPEELGALANRATRARREERPQSAEEFREALASWRRHRGSHELAKEALARLEELEALGGDADPVRFARLASECRFGFVQALREWEGNASARAGLRRCLEKSLRYALAQGDLGAARGLLGEVDDAELRAQVEALAEAQRQREQKALEAERHAHEQDLSVSAGSRRALFAVLLVGAMLLNVAFLWGRGTAATQTLTPWTLVYGATGMVLFAGILLVALRRRLLANEANRRVVAVPGVLFLGFWLDRLFGALTGRSTYQTLVSDLVMITVVTALGALLAHRAMAQGALLCLLAALGCVLFPVATSWLFSLVPLLGFLVVGLQLNRVEGPSSATSRGRGNLPGGSGV